MGNYVGYFYPITPSVNTSSSQEKELSLQHHKLLTKINFSSNKHSFPCNIKKHSVSCISSSTEDSLSRSEEYDNDKNTINKSLYFDENINANQKINSFPQNIFYYDWDDTLFFTTAMKFRFFEYCGNLYTEKNEDNNLLLLHFKSEISNLDKLTSSILSKSFLLGNVYIVTNSSINWVFDNAKKYYPYSMNVISSGKVKVISARDKYGKSIPYDKLKWKKKSFLDIAGNYNNEKETNIVSLGDGKWDIDAVIEASKYFNKCVVKTVKFRERPSFEELIFQLDEYLLRFDEIFEYRGNNNYIL